jgi:tetrahydromethanopterin S-methyltransferase subunit F
VTPQRFQGFAVGFMLAALLLLVTIPLIFLGLRH